MGNTKKIHYFCTLFCAKIMLKVLILTLGIVFIAVLMFGVRVFFVKGGRFPNIHIEGNKALRKKGIHCAKSMDKLERKQITSSHYEKD